MQTEDDDFEENVRRVKKQGYCEFVRENLDHDLLEFVLGSIATLGLLPVLSYIAYKDRVKDYVQETQIKPLIP